MSRMVGFVAVARLKNQPKVPNWAMKKKTSCSGYIGDYTTQLYKDYNKPLQGSLLNNQYNGKSDSFFRGSIRLLDPN